MRFDEEENAVGIDYSGGVPVFRDAASPTVSRVLSAYRFLFPSLDNGAIAGWMYFNLDNPLDGGFPRQAWIVTTLFAEGRYSGDSNATALGNGCSRAIDASRMHYRGDYWGSPRPR